MKFSIVQLKYVHTACVSGDRKRHVLSLSNGKKSVTKKSFCLSREVILQMLIYCDVAFVVSG